MNDAFAVFVWVSYGVSALALGLTTFAVLRAYRRVKSRLMALEKKP